MGTRTLEGLTCGCADRIESWWEEDAEGRPMLYIDDSRVPGFCQTAARRFADGDQFVTVAVAPAVIESGR